jgi:hypothetical protein
MAIATLLTIVATSLSALMVPLVSLQLKQTRHVSDRMGALNAAEAGLDVAIAHLRAAGDADGKGRLSALPCAQLSGGVSSVSAARYAVTVRYFLFDPQGRSEAWIQDPVNSISCGGSGAPELTPNFALVTSEGVNAAARRTLRATYPFRTTNENIPGGVVQVFKVAGTKDLCWDVGPTPTTGTGILLQTCMPGSAEQKFAYNTNLTLTLVSSKTNLLPNGLCVDAGIAHANGNEVELQPCVSPAPPRHQWSYNGTANFQGTADGVTLHGFCFHVQFPDSVGSPLILGDCGNTGVTDITRRFVPEATVGAGAAGASTTQLVNFRQFGRCLDVTSGHLESLYLIAWTCKQAPTAAGVGWNQKWPFSLVGGGPAGQYVVNHGGRFCLESPGGAGPGRYPVARACEEKPAMLWTRVEESDDNLLSYTVRDAWGSCMQPTDLSAPVPDVHGSAGTSRIIVATCDGSLLQKWNAPPSVVSPLPIRDLQEK